MQTAQQSGKRKSLLLFYWLGLMAVLLLLVTATYTWFSISRTPRVSDMDLYVATPAGLEIALRPDSEEWGQSLRFTDMVSAAAPLKPCTWSERNQQFFGMDYGADGRMRDRWTPLTDGENANKEGAAGYYTVGTFYARTDAFMTVSLSEAVAMENGTAGSGTYLIGTPVWNERTLQHDNGGSGAETAVRIGLKVTPMQNGTETGQSTFYIYEPNCNAHVGGGTDYQDTRSIDGTDTLVPKERLITQTASDWTEADPVQAAVVMRRMGEFTSDTKLFAMQANSMVRIDLYIWLEGQDVDCTNLIGQEAKILAAIQLKADSGGQSGMVPIS